MNVTILETDAVKTVIQYEGDNLMYGNRIAVNKVLRDGRSYWKSYYVFTVEGYSAEYNECPVEARNRAIAMGHELVALTQEAAVLEGPTNRPRKVCYGIAIGDEIKIEGNAYRVEKTWNDNLKLIAI